MSVESRVLLAQEDNNARNEIIREYRNYISSCAKKAAGRYISDQDDEMSIAMIAFDEAIRKHDSSKGSFLNFADIIIKNRLIDFMRKEYKGLTTIPFSELAKTDKNGDEIPFSVEDTKSNNNDAKYEIEALALELSKYDISFFDLSKISPKSKKTKTACFTVIKYIVQNPVLSNEIKRKGIIPIKTIVDAVDITVKKYKEKGVEVELQKLEKEELTLSKELGISLGKTKAVSEYTNVFGGSIKDNANKLSNFSVGEIRRAIREKKDIISNISIEQSNSTNGNSTAVVHEEEREEQESNRIHKKDRNNKNNINRNERIRQSQNKNRIKDAESERQERKAAQLEEKRERELEKQEKKAEQTEQKRERELEKQERKAGQVEQKREKELEKEERKAEQAEQKRIREMDRQERKADQTEEKRIREKDRQENKTSEKRR